MTAKHRIGNKVGVEAVICVWCVCIGVASTRTNNLSSRPQPNHVHLLADAEGFMQTSKKGMQYLREIPRLVIFPSVGTEACENGLKSVAREVLKLSDEKNFPSRIDFPFFQKIIYIPG